jgi:hypothetical protein
VALGRAIEKPSVFLSFAGEDLDWKQSLMEPRWWSSLTSAATIYAYDDRPVRAGELDAEMERRISGSSAFIALISKYYIAKDGVVELEFKSAVSRFKDKARQAFFYAVVIDPEGKEWWDKRANVLFEQHEWLRKKTYWDLIEDGGPALFDGKLRPHYARVVRKFAEDMAKEIVATPVVDPQVKPAEKSRIIVLGRPGADAAPGAPTNEGLEKAHEELLVEMRTRKVDVSDWGNGWARAKGEQQERRVRELLGPVGAIVRPLALHEAFEAAISPNVTFDYLEYLASDKAGRTDIRNIKTSLWLPSEHRDHPDAKVFLEKAKVRATDTNPILCIAAALELADRLAPRNQFAQISVEALDDLNPIETNGPTARKVVEEEVRAFVRKGAELARIELDPLIRQFLNYRRLANHILEAKGGRIMVVAHDLQEHFAQNYADAHRMLGNKVRNLKESVESIVDLGRGQIIPITVVVTNFEHLQNDFVLDEEIAGTKWWLLPGRVRDGRFTAEEDVYERITQNVSVMLQG